mmetsp:Transcript_38430/g.59805  ORF Transcript_38430/g.59805 Transcript_38430/m.59805 type:complete len:659 (-) Transcript_38430:79-2055(-)
MAGLDVAGSWDWQREMENFATRMARSRDEEVSVVRRSTEEAERATLRRMEEIERRMQRCQAEETNAMQSFLASWNSAVEAKLEKQRAQQASRVDALSETIDHMQDEVKAAIETAKSSEASSETWRSQLSSLGEELSQKTSAACESMKAHFDALSESMRATMHKEVEEARQHILDEINSRERQTQQSFAEFAERFETIDEAVKAAGAVTERCARVEESFGHVQEELNVLAGKTKAILEKHGCELGNIRSMLEAREAGVRSVVEIAEKRSDQAASEVFSELKDLRGHCENRFEAQARLTAESCKRLASEMRVLVDDATERAELAAANLDSKVAGALDAVMDARVAKGTHECTEEVLAAKSALEARLRGSEAFTERMLREEAHRGSKQLHTELANLREEMRSHVRESAEELTKHGKLPAYMGSAMDVAAGVNELLTDGMAESMTVPQELRTALQRRSSNSDVASPETSHLKPITAHTSAFAPDDVSSNVTVESDVQSSDSRQRSNWKSDGANWRRNAAPELQKQSSHLQGGAHPHAVASNSPKMPSPAALKTGTFAVAAKTTWAPNGGIRSSENLRPSSFSNIGKGSPAKAATKSTSGKTNPFDAPTNPFDGSFKEDAALLRKPGSPTPSFASPSDLQMPRISASGVMRQPGEPVSQISPF